MEENNVSVELKQVIGAMLFASKTPLRIQELGRVLKDAAENQGEEGAVFAGAGESDIKAALDVLKSALDSAGIGLHLVQVAGGYKFQTDSACGPWLREMLSIGKPPRLSHPALETLAIIAYRQPVSRSEIESVRGVNVDAMIRNLLELQLVKVTGRSELPGRPLLYGTTQKFLEHFGLASVKDLPGIQQLARRQPKNGKKEEKSGSGEEAPDPENSVENDTGAPCHESEGY